jgi:hypothetical protein
MIYYCYVHRHGMFSNVDHQQRSLRKSLHFRSAQKNVDKGHFQSGNLALNHSFCFLSWDGTLSTAVVGALMQCAKVMPAIVKFVLTCSLCGHIEALCEDDACGKSFCECDSR